MEKRENSIEESNILHKETAEQVVAQEGVKEDEEAQEDLSKAPSIETELEEAKDKYLRLYSEFENFRRRTSRERLALITMANKELIMELLPILDDFERAMDAESKDTPLTKEGISLIRHKLVKLLEQKGLKKMHIKKEDTFDDEKHEAITRVPAENMEGKIVDIIEAGYKLGETVVRFAKVVVGGAKQ